MAHQDDEEDYYKGVTFLNFQSGSPDEPSDRLAKLLVYFTREMHEMQIRVYHNLQIGKPQGGGKPPGGK